MFGLYQRIGSESTSRFFQFKLGSKWYSPVWNSGLSVVLCDVGDALRTPPVIIPPHSVHIHSSAALIMTEPTSLFYFSRTTQTRSIFPTPGFGYAIRSPAMSLWFSTIRIAFHSSSGASWLNSVSSGIFCPKQKASIQTKSYPFSASLVSLSLHDKFPLYTPSFPGKDMFIPALILPSSFFS